jgi:2-amino-4-hydroxy-6-hydroxymethyldihydropteridine diphosphokinase
MICPAVIGLGANLGDRRGQISEAARRIGSLYRVTSASALYECDAVGPPQPRYLNAAVLVAAELEPRRLLADLLAIERELGRERRERWGPRPIDLDILFIDGASVDAEGLVVPHPLLRERTFALRPLLDVLPAARDPKSGASYAESLERLVEPRLRRIAAPSQWWSSRNARNHE